MIHAIIDLEDHKGRITIKGTGSVLKTELAILVDGIMEDTDVAMMFTDILSDKIEEKMNNLEEKLNGKNNSSN